MHASNSILSLIILSFLLIGGTAAVRASSTSGACNVGITSSNGNYALPQGCATYSVTFANGVSNSMLECDNASLSPNSSISMQGSNAEDYLFNCSFDGARIMLGSNSNLNIVSPSKTDFAPSYGRNSSITVGYFLNVSVFEPFGSNSTAIFLNRVAAYGYIIPLLNNTITINNTQLQYVPSFSSYIINLIAKLRKTIPFGVYGQNSTQIFENFTHESYGNIFGHKVFMVPSYTLTATKRINYNPYAVDYSFIEYDQLVMYTLNITKDTTLMPVYIAPIYPAFNYNIIPDNNRHNLTIQWLVAVPPPDLSWNFSAYIYKYSTSLGFIMNPLNNTVPAKTSIAKLLSFPMDKYSANENGTLVYYLNYNASVGVGMNSSIIIMPGTIPNEGSYIQDSTTPSFGFGLGFCSTQGNNTFVSSIVNTSGYYNMPSNLQPVEINAPILENAPCYIGAYITGNNIAINCDNGNVTDSYYGFIIKSANNVSLYNCNIRGNGINISASRNIAIYNTTILPSATSSSNGIMIENSYNVTLSGVRVGTGFGSTYLLQNATDISLVNSNMSYSAGPANTTAPATTAATATQPTSKTSFLVKNQRLLLYLGSAIIIIIYIYLFFKLQYRPSKSAARKNKKRGK